MSKLVIAVPQGRRYAGRALLLGDDGALRFGPASVLATASGWAARRHGNPTRDWRRPYGHPPTGSYLVTGSLPPGTSPRTARVRRFGPLGALILSAYSGDAKVAADAGRLRFLVHGGPPDRGGGLRPTFGGLRFSDRDLGALFRAINVAFAQGDPLSGVELAETTQPAERGAPAGRLRPFFATRGGPTKAGIPLPSAALLALGFGALGRTRVPGAPVRANRRDFLGLALLIIGAAGTSACGSGDEAPSDVGCGPCASGPVGGGRSAADGGGGDGGDGGGPNGGYGDYGGTGGGVVVGGGDGCGACAGGGDVGAGGDITGGDVGGGGG